MVNDREGRRTRRLQVLRFFGVLALPVLMLGSAIAVAEWVANGAPTVEFARTPATPR
ncbi:hypothetical protein CO656_02845 [Sinorhizobium sp. FG01]|nr:hypothetical protein CO656_02845 [Sinorhizobium sp. FG01]